ncbi:MAG: serine/threonine protein phosphatase, partial [Clostridiales bacterium]|nr:serine/threonine protein phosphatase [Clostridiales bacterium]
EFPRLAFCGTRGWTAPGGREFTQQDQKIFDREILRLKLSLDSVKDADEIIVLLHFPPFTDRGGECQINNLLEQYPVSHVVFGHIHGEGLKAVTEGDIGDITYHLVSCDHLNFSPKLIKEF